MRGYSIEELSAQNLNESVDGEASETTIYTIDEDTVKDFLGDKINEVSSPIQYLFDNTKLSYLRKPVLVAVVSDAFYDRYGFRNYAEQGSGKTVKKNRRESVRRNVSDSRLAIYSFYLAAISFFLSGINVLFGNFFLSYFNPSYAIVPMAILLVSLAAITVRAFSLGREGKRSVLPVTLSIVLFIVILLIGMGASYYNVNLAQLFYDTGSVILSSSVDFLLVILAFIIMVAALSRYVLFLGSGAGTISYALAISGIVLIMAIVLVSNLPPIPILGTLNYPLIGPNQHPANVSTIVMLNFVFDPEFPIFGVGSYFQSVNFPQYALLRNDILFLANFILGLSFLSAIRFRNRISRAK